MSSSDNNHYFAHVVVLVIIITASLFFSKATITGNISKDVLRYPVDISINRSQSYVISSSNNLPLLLKSFSISGTVEGNGLVKVYLDNGAGVRRLVYSNVRGNALQNFGGATEFVGSKSSESFSFEHYRELEDNFGAGQGVNSFAGNFRSICSETCKLDSELFDNQRYEVLFYVEQGTTLRLTEISVT